MSSTIAIDEAKCYIICKIYNSLFLPPSNGTVTSMVADVRVEMLVSSAKGAPTENNLNSLTGKFSRTAI